MKTHETIGLNLAATLLVGLIASILIVFGGGMLSHSASSAHVESQQYFLAAMPLILAACAAIFQYQLVLKPLSRSLDELVAKALHLQETNPVATNQRADKLNMLRESIETASVQYKEVRQREKTLIQHAVDVICVIDLKGNFLSANPAAKTVWGYRPEELIGKQITDFIVSDDVKNTMTAIISAEKSIDRIFFENRFRKKNGEILDLLWSAYLSASEQGLFCIAHDITDRKRAETLLKESEEKVRRILEGLPAGVAVANRHGRLEFMNKTAMTLTRYGAHQVSDLPAAEIFSFFKNETFSHDDQNATIGSESNIDCQILRSTGDRFPAEASTSMISWDSSAAQLIVFLDATLKYEVESAKREFVAMVSHDLRTPLTTISLIFNYFLDGLGGDLSPGGVDFANKGQQSTQRLITLVQDLLDLEKMRAGKFVMDIVETSVSDLIEAAVSAIEPYAASQNIQLAIDQSEGNEQCYCDGGRIIQVLINLIGNAIKFSIAQGTVQIELENSDSFVTVSVRNQGRTIAPEKLTSIFEKFEQANSSESTERKGTGLGLAISKTLVEQHGGKIWAESSDEYGSKFSFTLPRVVAE